MTEQEKLSNAYENLKVRFWELKNGINNRGWRLSMAILEEKVAERDKEIAALREQLKAKNLRIEELKCTIRELEKVAPLEEGGVMVIHGTKELGRWIPQVKYLKLLEEWKYEKERNKQVKQEL